MGKIPVELIIQSIFVTSLALPTNSTQESYIHLHHRDFSLKRER
jgi:hypothetical protein